jgi:hypothetical protein
VTVKAAERDDPDPGRGLGDPGDRLQPVHHRYHEVEQHQVRTLGGPDADAVEAVPSLTDDIEAAVTGERGAEQNPPWLGIVDLCSPRRGDPGI